MIAPLSKIEFTKSSSWWLGASSPIIFKPESRACCLSNLACFSAAGNFLTKEPGSAESDLTCSFSEATIKVVASKCKRLRFDTCPKVGSAPYVLSVWWRCLRRSNGECQRWKTFHPLVLQPCQQSSRLVDVWTPFLKRSSAIDQCHGLQRGQWFKLNSKREMKITCMKSHLNALMNMMRKQTWFDNFWNLSQVQVSPPVVRHQMNSVTQVWSLSEISTNWKIWLRPLVHGNKTHYPNWCVSWDPSACFLQVFSTCPCKCVSKIKSVWIQINVCHKKFAIHNCTNWSILNDCSKLIWDSKGPQPFLNLRSALAALNLQTTPASPLGLVALTHNLQTGVS